MLIAATRIRDDTDIVEAFVRHHAGLVDRFVMLDNHSASATPDILAALREEGFPIALFRGGSITFDEPAQNTFLLRRAADLGADWVIFLDVDEFLDPRPLPEGLARVLAAIPADEPCVRVAMINYHPTGADDADQPVVPLRLRHREPADLPTTKVFARARAGGAVLAGQHGLLLDGRILPGRPAPALRIAHYPMRSGWQMLAKSVIGRLRVLAAGPSEIARGSNEHYVTMADHLRRHPEWVLGPDFLAGRADPGPLVVDPLPYRGGALRHGAMQPPPLAAAASLMAFAETLARRHGELVESHAVAADPVTRVF